MDKVCTLSILFLLALVTKGQTKKINGCGIEMQVSSLDTSLNALFCQVGQEPESTGGVTDLIAFAKRKIKYPRTAINDNVEGRVILIFVIDETGKVVDKKIFHTVRRDLDSVCLKMLSQMPNWKPARLNGKPIAVSERWKITFVLTD